MSAGSRFARFAATALILSLSACSKGSHKPGDTIAPAPLSTTPTAPTGPLDAGTTPPTGPTAQVPSSISSDCSADVTGSLNAWIASMPDNATLSFPTNGCYRLEGTLLIKNRTTLLLDGHGSTIKATSTGTRNRSHLEVLGGRDIIIRDLIIRGANPHAGSDPSAYESSLEAQHTFNLVGVQNVLLSDVQAYDPFGDFVYVSGVKRQMSEHVAVVDSRFDRSGRQGISVTDADDVVIARTLIADVPRSMFDLEANTAANTIRNVRIVDNTTGPAHNFWLADKGAGNDIGDVVVSGNVMKGPTGGLVFVFGHPGGSRGPFTFDDNVLQTNGTVTDEAAVGALFFANASEITVERNRITLPAGRHLPVVELRSCSHVVVKSNQSANGGRLVLADASTSDVQDSG